MGALPASVRFSAPNAAAGPLMVRPLQPAQQHASSGERWTWRGPEGGRGLVRVCLLGMACPGTLPHPEQRVAKHLH